MVTSSNDVLFAIFMVPPISENSSAIFVPRDEQVHAIRAAFAAKQGIADDYVTLYKPNEFLPRGRKGRSELNRRLAQYDSELDDFCEDFTLVEGLLINDQFDLEKPTSALVAYIDANAKPLKRAEELKDLMNEQDATLGALIQRYKQGVRTLVTNLSSVAAQPRYYYEYQLTESPILDGRYASKPLLLSPPVQIYHPAFASFVAEASDERIQLPTELVKGTVEFMVAVSKIATQESSRGQTSRVGLQALLVATVNQVCSTDSIPNHTLAVIRKSAPFGTAALAIVEEKEELGFLGEGSVQGSFSYRAHWLSEDPLRDACSCPSFIISLAGPWMVICAAMWTTGVIVHRLTDYIWMGHSCAIDDTHTLRVARIFHALGRAIGRLREYYEELTVPTHQITRYAPLATSYKDPKSDRIISFQYQSYLQVKTPSCVTFLAMLNDDDETKVVLVVKFVERYSVEAHERLARDGTAPQLLYCGNVWPNAPECDGCRPRMMVVMEYIEGKNAAEAWPSTRVPVDVCNAVHAAILALHGEGMVHGDIRPPNILIPAATVDGDSSPVAPQVKIIDFDWAGKIGEVRYPLHLSKGIWVEGVDDHELIRPEHDIEMIRKLERP